MKPLKLKGLKFAFTSSKPLGMLPFFAATCLGRWLCPQTLPSYSVMRMAETNIMLLPESFFFPERVHTGTLDIYEIDKRAIQDTVN